MYSGCCGDVNTCVFNQDIDTEDYVLGSDSDITVEQIDIKTNYPFKGIRYLPRQMGKKFPNLKEFGADADLVIVRNHYFKGMRSLQLLSLDNNNIKTIESRSFKDLIRVERLNLNFNELETLDGNLFVTMVNLEKILMDSNNIKFLSPTTFNIPGGKLWLVTLKRNACLDEKYSNNNDRLVVDIENKCTQ